ncbi:MAG: S9 family peptidase, partial [Candidatus Sericytochromatia bacterium]|nr:S9 family peptidase [Candidatus Sericytochromatia bacterium]
MKKDIKPPVAKVLPFEITYHDEVYHDDYAWLKEKTNPDVISYLEEENNYLKDNMLHTKDFQDSLYKEMLARIKETDISVPEKLEDYYYYSRTEEGKQYRIHCRKKLSLDAPEQILLDLNKLTEESDYLSLGVYKVSPDHKYLAYSIDNDGSESYTLFVKEIDTDIHLKDEIKNSSSVEWLNDNSTILYSILDDSKRPYQAYQHILGSEINNDVLLYHEEDEAFFLDLSKTNSQKYIFMSMFSQTTSEVYYMKANNPQDKFKLVEKRQKDIEYCLDDQEDFFYVVTNADQANNFKIMKAPLDNPSKSNWTDFIEHRENIKVDYINVMKNHLIIYERENGLKTIRIKTDKTDYYIDFPEPVYDFNPAKNRDYNSNMFRFYYSSLVTPDTVFDYNMDDKTREIKKQYEVFGYDSNNYQSERIFAKSEDGTMIPISIVYKKGMKKDGNNPLYLYGYGSYEISMDPAFSSNRLSLIDRGFVYAIAHIRGGGDMGRKWYESGKFLNKKNTFKDFIASAEHLINEKYTAKEKIVAMGGSAGGLLMGAVTNMRPDLFKVVVAHVPFVDVINTMMDPTLPLTVIEYDEWGDPNDKKYFDYMKSYSPYDNVEAKDYPIMYISGGLNDPRVGYWEPAKLAAKLRKMKTDNNLLVLKTNMGAGHGGPSGRYDHLKEVAEEYAFVLDMFGY